LAKFETLLLTLLAALLWVLISIPVAIGVGIVISRGVLIYETFARGNECLGQPRNPDFLLRPGELLEAFAILTVGPSSRAKCLSRGAPSFSASPQSPAHSGGCQKLQATGR
jgi:hypothetical protein